MPEYKLFVPEGHGWSLPIISGRIGATPYKSLAGSPGRGLRMCYRTRLPAFLDQLTFTFAESEGRARVQDFYFFEDFFLVSSQFKDFLIRELGPHLEIAEVSVRYRDGTPSKEQYFAVKATRVVDCIDPAPVHSSEKIWIVPDEIVR